MIIPAFQLVVFDMDDTLYPESTFVQSGYGEVSKWLQEKSGRHEDFGGWMWQRFLTGKISGAFDAANEHFDLGLTDKDISYMVEIYRNHNPKISPFEDIPALLCKLRKHFLLGVITDGPAEMQRKKFNQLGLGRFFHSVIFTGEMPAGSAKPNTTSFEKIAADLKITAPSACVYIGDNPSKDFLGPNKLGWMTIQFHRPGQVHFQQPAPAGGLPQAAVSSIEELESLLYVGCGE